MNRKGFTLMELLLVVAVLAIVAAAAAPTFFGGAQDAMNEAKKASMMSAYQNTMSGANMLTSIAASKGVLPTTAGVLTVNLPKNDGTTGTDNKTIADYAPLAARIFTNIAGTKYAFGAYYDGNKVVAFYNTCDGTNEPTYAQANVINDANTDLEAKWKSLNTTTP